MITLRECASDEVNKKIKELTDPLSISVLNLILDKSFFNLTYLDSTFLRDILEIDLNSLVLNFNKK